MHYQIGTMKLGRVKPLIYSKKEKNVVVMCLLHENPQEYQIMITPRIITIL